ncbi:MAG: CRISPR-associated endoribonuclease Cas6 [Peptococcaceae bacterium]|nr:CRISPR-associated endoribonuclease Cas6 [Candidatus Syntrophopropionicum ammoniitolerans]
MHITLQFKVEDGFEIPLHYNHILQGVIYNTIGRPLAGFLHNKGFMSNGRSFKLFSFSRLNGRYEIHKGKESIEFFDDVNMTISSPVDEFCNSIANGMLTKRWIDLGSNRVEAKKMLVRQHRVEKQEVRIRTLSPIVVYSTLLRPDGRKYTCYFQPGDPDYDRLISGNLRKKYEAYYNEEAPAGDVKVERLSQVKMHVMNYKNTVIKGYSGKLLLTGPSELLQMAVDAGLGSKNSQGFGCVEVV